MSHAGNDALLEQLYEDFLEEFLNEGFSETEASDMAEARAYKALEDGPG